MLFELKTAYENLERKVIERSDTGMRHKIAVKKRTLDFFIADFKRFKDEITVSRQEIVVHHNVKLRRVI